MKKRGYSVIELIVIIGIVGTLLALSANSYRGWRSQSIFTDRIDRLFEMFTTARVNALSEKKCLSGDVSQKWVIQINDNIERNFRLFCNGTADENREEPLSASDVEYTFPEEIFSYDVFLGGAVIAEPLMEVEFFSGDPQTRINSDFSNNDFRIDFQSQTKTDLQRTICFERVSGYAYFSKTFGSCVE